MTQMVVCDFQGSVIKDTVAPSYLSLSSPGHSHGRNLARMCEATPAALTVTNTEALDKIHGPPRPLSLGVFHAIGCGCRGDSGRNFHAANRGAPVFQSGEGFRVGGTEIRANTDELTCRRLSLQEQSAQGTLGLLCVSV